MNIHTYDPLAGDACKVVIFTYVRVFLGSGSLPLIPSGITVPIEGKRECFIRTIKSGASEWKLFHWICYTILYRGRPSTLLVNV